MKPQSYGTVLPYKSITVGVPSQCLISSLGNGGRGSNYPIIFVRLFIGIATILKTQPIQVVSSLILLEAQICILVYQIN